MNSVQALIKLVLDKVSTKKVTDDIAGALKEGGKKGGAEFSESVMSRARTMLSGGGGKKKVEDIGVKLAQSIRAGFDREMADIKVARAGKFINDSEAARQGQAAAEHYRRAALAALDRGDISDKGITKLTGTLNHIETQGRKAGETYAQSVGNGIKKWAAGVAASIAAMFAVRQVISFVKDSVGAFMESSRATEAMRESARQASYAWQDLKASVGQAVVVMLGGNGSVDTLSDKIRDLTGWVDDNRETWSRWGAELGDFGRQVVREFNMAADEIRRLVRFAQVEWQYFKNQIGIKPGPPGFDKADLYGIGGLAPPGTTNKRTRLDQSVLDEIRATSDLNTLLERQTKIRRALNDERAKANPIKERVDALSLELTEVGNRLTEVRVAGKDARAAETAARKAQREMEAAARKAERESEAAARKARRDAAQDLAAEIALIAEAQGLGVTTSTERTRAVELEADLNARLAKGNLTLKDRLTLQRHLNTLAALRRQEDEDAQQLRDREKADRDFNRDDSKLRPRMGGSNRIYRAGVLLEGYDEEQAKLAPFVDAWREAHRDMENATQNVAAGIMNSFGSAIEMLVSGAGTIGDAFTGLGAGIAADILGGIKQLATGKVAEEIAWAYSSFARGDVPSGTAALLAAAKWTAAGGVAAGLGGAIGGIGRGGGAHRGAGIYGREAAGNTQPHNVTYVYVQPFDPKNPVQTRQIGKAMELHVELAGRPAWAR